MVYIYRVAGDVFNTSQIKKRTTYLFRDVNVIMILIYDICVGFHIQCIHLQQQSMPGLKRAPVALSQSSAAEAEHHIARLTHQEVKGNCRVPLPSQ